MVIKLNDFMTLDEFLELFDGVPAFIMAMYAKEFMLLGEFIS
jgi:hypothetical protein